MAVTSVSDLNSLFNTIFDDALFVAREMNLMAGLVDNRSATGWMDRKVPIRPQVSAVSVGETQDFNNPTTFGATNKATISPGEVIAQVTLTDRNMETDPYGAQQDATRELGMAVGTKIDSDLVGVFSSATKEKGTGVGNSATIASAAAGIAVLGNQHAMQFGGVSAVWHPYHWHDLWVELGQPSANQALLGETANQAIRDYFVGRFLNATHYTSANIAVDGSDDAVSGLFTRPAIMLDTRRAPRLEPERDASARAWELNITAGYGYGIVRDEFIVKYTADASEPS